MFGESVLTRYEIYVSTAVVAAHASAKGQGFRQRDVKFFIELFSNWVESDLPQRALTVQNTQVLRYLEELVAEGYARKISKDKRPVYRLTRTGLLELVGRSVDSERFKTREQFLFLLYYIKHYRPLVEALVKAEGRQFPYSLKLELDLLFDSSTLIEREISRAKLELKRLERRAADSLAQSKLVAELQRSGMPDADIVQRVERQFPYELNSQKPLSELIADLPQEMQLWELTVGYQNRAREIWEPMKTALHNYIEQLKGLA